MALPRNFHLLTERPEMALNRTSCCHIISRKAAIGGFSVGVKKRYN
jgi:hypothetical protein